MGRPRPGPRTRDPAELGEGDREGRDLTVGLVADRDDCGSRGRRAAAAPSHRRPRRGPPGSSGAGRGRRASGSPYIVRWTTVPSNSRTNFFQSSTPSTANAPPHCLPDPVDPFGERRVRGMEVEPLRPEGARRQGRRASSSRGSRPARWPTRRTETLGRSLRRGRGMEPFDPVAAILELVRPLHESLQPCRGHPELLGDVGEEPTGVPDGVEDPLLELLVVLVRHRGDRRGSR